MNYFLELYHINEYFRRVSSMDTERIAAAESIALELSHIKQMVRKLMLEEIPEYYLDESSVEGLSCEGIVTEVKKRGHLCRWKQRNGISKVKVDFTLEHFVVESDYEGGWKLLYRPFYIDTKKKVYELKDMPVKSLVDMMEDIVAVPYSIEQLYKMYVDMIGTSYGPEHLMDAEYFKDIQEIMCDGDLYYGLLEIAIDESYKAKTLGRAPSNKRVDAIREGFKKNKMVAELTAQTICQAKFDLCEERLFQANTIEYTCFSSCILLLAPYGSRGAIIGTVDYSGLPHIKEILRQIAAFKEGDTLPEGFRLLK